MDKPVIVITGTPAWFDAVTAALQPDHEVIHLAQAGSYMKTLIDRIAALVLVDGDAPGWDKWTSVPKSSPATRRIPIILVSVDRETRAASATKGADLALDPAELKTGLMSYIADFARLPDPERVAQLDCECDEALPPRGVEGVAKFNAGEYYQQHDLFEAQWVETTTPVRDLYRAILQVGIAYYQIERGNYRGALKMLQRSVQRLVILPEVCQGVNIAKLRADSFRVRAELERLGEARLPEFDKALIQPVEMVNAEKP
jgi:predicted metal-dependent hydrolase